MTFAERARLQYPMIAEDELVRMCPEDLGLEKKSPCGVIEAMQALETPGLCRKCWERTCLE